MSFTPNHQNLQRDRLADAIRALPLTTKEIARRVGVAPRTVEGWKAGTSAPSYDAVVAACREFDSIWDVMKDAAGRANSNAEAETIISEFTRRLRERRASAP